MNQIQVRMDPQQFGSLKETESSIQEWSSKHTLLQIQADGAKSTVQTLYARRQGMIQKFLKESGLNMAQVVSVDVSEDGLFSVHVNSAPPAAPDGDPPSPP